MPAHKSLLMIAQRLNLPHVRELAKQAGVKAVLRITTHYPDRHAFNSVATLVSSRLEPMTLEVIYEGFLLSKTIRHTIDETVVASLTNMLAEVKFDKLPDQPSPNLETMTLWLLERASGSFYTSIVLSPYRVEHPYSRIVNALDDYLPEAIREIAQS